MANLKWHSHSGNACPSCAALAGQVHTQEEWDEFGVKPGDHTLYCGEACSCTMEETDAEETGNLDSVPLRQENSLTAPSTASTPPRYQSRSLRSTAKPQGEPMPKTAHPIMRSMPIVEKLEIPARADILPKIESGEIDHIDFSARVYGTGRNRNPYLFKDADLDNFAKSFEGQPFLRNHDTYDIDSRDGTILESANEGGAFRQTIRLTTRRGMLDFIEGKIDRFSIGWFYDDVMCSICNSSWFGCPHWPGNTYKTDSGDKRCELTFINPSGKETSAVNVPAVEGTSIDEFGLAELQEFKLGLIGDVTAADDTRRVSNSQLLKGVKTMDPVTSANSQNAAQDTQAQIDSNRAAAAELLDEQARLQALESQLQESNQILIAQCEHLLNTGLQTSRLPEIVQNRVRSQFANRAFKATELNAAIKAAQEEVAQLTAGMTVQGPARGRITGMMTGPDAFKLAVEDLFGMPREAADANKQVARLSGIREAYLMATGDQGFMGGYYPEFALVTGNFPGIVANVMNKMLIKAWADFEQHYGWWQKIATIEHFTNLNDVTWIRTGTIASLPTVSERGEYTELAIGDNKETSSFSKYGGYIPITIEAVLRDDLRAFTRMPREAALAGIRNVSEQVAAIFTSNSGAGPTLADTGALFNSTAVTTAGGHANLLTTALGTDYTAWNAVALAMYNQPLLVKNATNYYGAGKKMAIDPRYALVPRALKAAAEALFIPRWEAPAQNVAAVSPTWGGRVEPLVVPEWTDATDWAAVADPALVPGIMIGEIFGVKPQIFSASSEIDPAMFANDESRIKVRQFLTVGVADFRPLHKENVAG